MEKVHSVLVVGVLVCSCYSRTQIPHKHLNETPLRAQEENKKGALVIFVNITFSVATKLRKNQFLGTLGVILFVRGFFSSSYWHGVIWAVLLFGCSDVTCQVCLLVTEN